MALARGGLAILSPVAGVVHLSTLQGHAEPAAPEELARTAADEGARALALVQGLLDAEAVPTSGTWFVTEGAQRSSGNRTARLSAQPCGVSERPWHGKPRSCSPE